MKVSKSNRVFGDVYISGSKNAAMPCICAALLTKKKVILRNIPDIDDVNNLIRIIKGLGVYIKRKDDVLIIKARRLKTKITSDLVEKLRGSYYLMGSILSRKKKIKTKYPGGCSFCDRPIDYHLKGFEEMGYKIISNDHDLEIKEVKRVAKKITFPQVSLGATINIILIASSIKEETIITNPSLEPEVLCVIDMLKQMGVKIELKNNQLYINKETKLKGVDYRIINDRIEAGSYLFLASAIPNSKITLHNVNVKELETVIIAARRIGTKITKLKDALIVEGSKNIKRTNILIGPYPFFPTDLQQIISVVLTKADRTSIIEDPIFPNRISLVNELKKMHADIKMENNQIIIKKSTLIAAKVKATDLRCAFALIVAGAIADGSTYIYNIDYLFRGYVNPVEKLKKIGIHVQLI
ncbi:MAG: UDP-N-acetylglucosamine 1-carboxyvinyltransferase [Bacilli bacterium]|nr:UDP-N-acetylglucosamine 1-carboxyvinyltransferase [Bacilli bacterium]